MYYYVTNFSSLSYPLQQVAKFHESLACPPQETVSAYDNWIENSYNGMFYCNLMY